jgi:hypothetical protein
MGLLNLLLTRWSCLDGSVECSAAVDAIAWLRHGPFAEGNEPHRSEGATTEPIESETMAPLVVHELLPEVRDGYPRVFLPHARGVNWLALDDYAEGGVGSADDFNVFVKTKREFDTAWINGRFAFTDSLRHVLEKAAGGPVEFRPIRVNDRPFWIMAVRHVVDALDVALSDYEPSVDGGIKLLNAPVWRATHLVDPSLFTVPALPTTIWATSGVVRAYEESGCDGLVFGPRGRVI